MAYDASRYVAVRDAYINKSQPIAAIARNSGVSEATVRRWRRKDKGTVQDWDTTKRVRGSGVSDTLISEALRDMVSLQTSVLKDLERCELDPLEKAGAITSLSDALTKCMSVVRKQDEKKIRLDIVQFILEELGSYLIQNHAEVAPAYLDILEPFGIKIAEKVQQG